MAQSLCASCGCTTATGCGSRPAQSGKTKAAEKAKGSITALRTPAPKTAAAHTTSMFAKCSTRLYRATQEHSSLDCRNMISPQAPGVG
jgi:hypothetical protein